MRFQGTAPDLLPTENSLTKLFCYHSLQVFILKDIIPRRMNTYAIEKASLKTKDFISRRMNTYTKSHPNPLYNEHLQKTRGVGGIGANYHGGNHGKS